MQICGTATVAAVHPSSQQSGICSPFWTDVPHAQIVQQKRGKSTLDLGGFAVVSTNACTGSPVASCTTVNGVTSISTATDRVAVRNGSVLAMGGSCVSLTERASEVDQARALSCGANGIEVGESSRVARSSSELNYSAGISLLGASVAKSNETRGNRLQGIGFDSPSLRGVALANRALDHGSIGIWPLGVAALATKNVIKGANPLVGVASTGDNPCDAGFR